MGGMVKMDWIWEAFFCNNKLRNAGLEITGELPTHLYTAVLHGQQVVIGGDWW
jgi:hypothetical protein